MDAESLINPQHMIVAQTARSNLKPQLSFFTGNVPINSIEFATLKIERAENARDYRGSFHFAITWLLKSFAMTALAISPLHGRL